MLTITPERIESALARAGPHDGALFEQFAKDFLSALDANLRPLGFYDPAIDAFVFSPDSDPDECYQISVTQDWQSKVARTIETLAAHSIVCRLLVLVSPQQIGIASQPVARELRKTHNIQ